MDKKPYTRYIATCVEQKKGFESDFVKSFPGATEWDFVEALLSYSLERHGALIKREVSKLSNK